jgi:N-methylhydantoinase A
MDMAGTAVAVDIGGTFTDLAVRYPDGSTQTTKALTTPGALADGVIEALQLSGASPADVEFFVHGTTAGLNALLERKFAKVGLITTEGFRDVYEIGRANRPAMYDLYFHRPAPLVGRELRLEVRERMLADGQVRIELDEDSLRASADRLAQAGVGAIAVVLLHAYANPAHELRCAELIGEWYPQIAVSLSHRIANEWREYERTSTTVVNAAIAQTVSAYLAGLERQLGETGVPTSVHVMQSNGGMTTARRARELPVNTLLSGPVGGAIAAAHAARQEGLAHALAVDMGGTSFDVSLVVDGEPQLAREAQIEGQPLLLSAIDVHTIGAGGGSIAWSSAGGLRVGPRSAGAAPGPACYGRGGTAPTVTDANVFLDRVNAAYFLGGGMQLHPDQAASALQRLAAELHMDAETLAAGILAIINARMAALMRQITIGRGLDPREFALIAFGGAGPMHAVFLAEELGIDTVLVPYSPGTFSAQGMLAADISHDIVRPFFVRWDRLDSAQAAALVQDMKAEGRQLLAADGIAGADIRFRCSADLRYVGQEHSLTLPFTRMDAPLLRRFHRNYRTTFGHANPDEHVEVVSIRVTAIGLNRRPARDSAVAGGEGKPYVFQEIRMRDARQSTPRYRREDLYAGQQVSGPLVVDEASCTTVIPDSWVLTVDQSGGMRVTRER